MIHKKDICNRINKNKNIMYIHNENKIKYIKENICNSYDKRKTLCICL